MNKALFLLSGEKMENTPITSLALVPLGSERGYNSNI